LAKCGRRCSLCMKFLVAAAMLAFIAWVFVQHFRQRRVAGPQERFFQIRSWAFTALVSLVCVLAFIILPDKGRVLLLAPIFIGAVTLAKWMQNTRVRLRSEEAERSNFERAKRIN
jgi:cell division protein FtsW (lipid II flippase)